MVILLDGVMAFLDKILTVVVDRRFWVAVLTVVLTVGGLAGLSDEMLQQIEEAFGEDGEAIAVAAERLVQAVITLIVALRLITSWTVREPSGLGPFIGRRRSSVPDGAREYFS